jgi:predicted dehydrogenase
MEKIKFGVLSTAQIGINHVIPAIIKSKNCELAAIASRRIQKAEKAGRQFDINTFYSNYDELLKDKNIDAVYIPLPNHLHTDWSLKALKAGKHVLCEKPFSLNSKDGQKVINFLKKPSKLVFMEAFMYGFHKQWSKARELLCDGKIGDIIDVKSTFTYFNNDPDNIRNKYLEGGGGLLDVGCYCINVTRMIYNEEPEMVFGKIKYDSGFGVDVYVKGMMKFNHGLASFSAGTKASPHEEVRIIGTKGMLTINHPFYGVPTMESNTTIHLCPNYGEKISFEIEGENQYMKMVDHFAESILNETPPKITLQNSINNMKVIDAIFASDKSGKWERVIN